jgi:hypothetical protein
MTLTDNSLQTLTTACTAFSTWTQFAAAMDAGYVPTLRPYTGRSKAQREWNAKVVQLADKLEALGWKVYRGR